MEQFVKQFNNADEERINEEIQKQHERGYKAISVAAGTNNWGIFTVVILFEKIQDQTENV